MGFYFLTQGPGIACPAEFSVATFNQFFERLLAPSCPNEARPIDNDCNTETTCGEIDPRYGASLVYFKEGRAVGKPWLWVSVPKTGHQKSKPLEQFVMSYFSTVLREETGNAVYVDIDRQTVIAEEDAALSPSTSAWLPSEQLFDGWKKVHEPW